MAGPRYNIMALHRKEMTTAGTELMPIHKPMLRGALCVLGCSAVVLVWSVFVGTLLALIVFALLVRFVYVPWEYRNAEKHYDEFMKQGAKP